ncbi:MAG: threonine synthase [Phycisphaerales bacterium]|nr:threonine synthase [Phycisphaerales bacterium]
MRYLSTRGGMPPATFSEILLGGLAPDGGLTIPEHYPTLAPGELASWRSLSYPELAFAILHKFADDLPAADLRALVDRTYTAEHFLTTAITPTVNLLDEVWLLRLSNGPTLAFKDIAMQLLGNLFEYALLKTGGHLNILGATSGDTGSSAEYAMRGKHGIQVFMLSPYQKMSRFQTAQMFSLPDPNIFNIAVRGVFDDCQDIVKAVSNDAQFKARHAIGTVNSINWARVAAQIVYYFKAWLTVTTRDDQEVSFAVPSGNFGNICAGYIAKRMGLPVRRLILATNENNVLDEFFRTGVYRVRQTDQVAHTSSPSMDISKASNFERFIFDAVGRDPAAVRRLWQQLDTQGFFDLSGTDAARTIAQSGFVSGSSNHADRMSMIRWVHRECGTVIDTHTADGIKVGLEYREKGVPLICLETALPAKFEDSIVEALGHPPERPAGYENIEKLPQRFEVMDVNTDQIKDYIVQHTS